MVDTLIKLTNYGLSPSRSASDNSYTLSSVIAQAYNNGGGYLVVDPGTYKINDTISLLENVSLIGSGEDVTKFQMQSINPIVSLEGSAEGYLTGTRIENITLLGSGVATYGIKFSYAIYGNTIQNVKITNCSGAGIYFEGQNNIEYIGGCWGNTIQNCVISFCGQGINLGQASNITKIFNCAISSNVGAGIVMETSTAVNIAGCSIEKNGTGGVEEIGIKISGGQPSIISGCYFEGNGVGDGIDIYTESSTINGVEGTTVVGCYFNGLDDKTKNAFSIGNGEVTIIGGQSNRHIGKTIVVRDDSTVNRLGFVSADSEGMI